jgi:hypothetical protein
MSVVPREFSVCEAGRSVFTVRFARLAGRPAQTASQSKLKSAGVRTRSHDSHPSLNRSSGGRAWVRARGERMTQGAPCEPPPGRSTDNQKSPTATRLAAAAITPYSVGRSSPDRPPEEDLTPPPLQRGGGACRHNIPLHGSKRLQADVGSVRAATIWGRRPIASTRCGLERVSSAPIRRRSRRAVLRSHGRSRPLGVRQRSRHRTDHRPSPQPFSRGRGRETAPCSRD